MEQAGRNDPCPCGSGRKYKRCCLGREAEHEAFGSLLESTALPLLNRLARYAQSAAGMSLEAVARAEFPFWRGKLDRAQGARIVDFLMFDLRPAHFGRRTVEQFVVETAPMSSADAQRMLAMWVDAPRRLFRAGSWSAGFTTCTDMFDPVSASIEVFDVEAVWQPAPGEPFAIRPLPVGAHAICAGRPVSFGGRSADAVAEAVRRRHLDFVRRRRIAGIDDFLRLDPKALDEEAAQRESTSSIVIPGV